MQGLGFAFPGNGRAPGNPGHFPFPISWEWNYLIPGENRNGAADDIAVI